MFIDRYQVEIQNLVTGKWIVDQCFRLRFWRFVICRIFKSLRYARSDFNIQIQILISKSEARRRAQHVLRTEYPRSVRIIRIDREGVWLVKFVVWQDGKWCE